MPIILMFITSLIGGIRIRTMWMTTFYVFPGIFFVYLFNSNILLEKFKKFYTIFLFIFLMLPIAYGAESYVQKDKRTDFPEKKLLKKFKQLGMKTFPITSILLLEMDGYMVDGMAGNLSYHLKDRPKLRYDWKKILKIQVLLKLMNLTILNCVMESY